MKLLDLRRRSLGLVLAIVLGLAGCGGGGGGDGAEPSPPPVARAPASALVTVRGVELESDGGARVQIPASASIHDFEARIASSSEGAPPLPDGLVPLGAMVSMQPHGAVFTMPIHVSLPFDPAAVPPGATVKVARGHPDGRWELLPGTVDGARVGASTTGFSYYMPVIVRSATYIFPPTTPFGEVVLPGQTPLAAQTPVALLANGDPNPFIPVQNYQVFTQAQLNTPLSLTLRGAVPASSDLDQFCGTRELRLVVTAFTARIFPDPANASRTLVRTNRLVRIGGGFEYDEPLELASIVVPRDGQTRSVNFQVNLAHHAYQLGADDYPPDPWTGGLPSFGLWSGPDPLPLTGAAGLTLATHYTCSATGWFTQHDRTPKTALRRGFADSVAFTGMPVDQTVVEGEPVTFRARLVTPANASATRSVVVKWQRALDGAPDLWTDMDPDTSSDAQMAGWLTNDRSNFTLWPDGTGSLTHPGVNRSEHNGTLVRAVACQYNISVDTGAITRGACVNSTPARLTVTQDFVAPQVLTHPTPQITVRENAVGQVTQFSATFSGLPRPTVRWETKAPGSPAWEPVDASSHTQNGATLSTTRAFTLADRGREYRAVATNAGGSTSTFSSVLFVTTGLEAPAITTQPQDASVPAGQAVLFAASVTGSAPLSYQWFFNGSAIPGANGPLLTLNNVNAANAGGYQLEAGNRENRVRSRVARLSVASASTPPVVAAPRILTPPAGLTVTAGNSATFAVGAAGTEPLAWQWFKDDQPIDGATASALTLGSVSAAQAGRYAVLVRNAGGSVRTADVVLVVRPADADPGPPQAPVIVTQPTGLAITVGQGATLAVAATGSGPLRFQWRRNGVPIAGANGPILTVALAGVNDAGQYSVLVGNGAGETTSADAGLVVTPAPGAPAITTPPADRSVVVGQTASFSSAVSGSPAPLCLWLRNGIVIAGATDCSGYTTPPLGLADAGVVYNLFVYSPGGYAFAGGALVNVTPAVAPTITAQPANQTVAPGGSASFTVGASGTPTPTVEWGVNGALLGASGRYVLGACSFDHSSQGGTLGLSNITADCDGAQFVAQARNLAGSVLSDAATLAVRAAGVTATLLAGSPGVTGSVDGPLDAARFHTPNYLAVARDGGIVIGDFGNSTLRVVAGTEVRTLAGSPGVFAFADGTGSAARFAGNGGVGFDSAGNVYVSDWDNHVIRRVTPDGVVTTFAGGPGIAAAVDGPGASARFSNPNGLVVDASDNVYVADWGNHTIRKITPAGVVSTFAGSPGQRGQADGVGGAARFNVPGGLAIDGSGNLYVADMFNHTVRKITPAGEVSTLAGSPGLSGTADGTGGAARFEQPAWIASTADGTLFVVSAAGDTVRRVTPAGVVETVVGVLGDSATLRLGSNPRLRNARGVWAVSATELLLNADHTLIRVQLP